MVFQIYMNFFDCYTLGALQNKGHPSLHTLNCLHIVLCHWNCHILDCCFFLLQNSDSEKKTGVVVTVTSPWSPTVFSWLPVQILRYLDDKNCTCCSLFQFPIVILVLLVHISHYLWQLFCCVYITLLLTLMNYSILQRNVKLLL